MDQEPCLMYILNSNVTAEKNSVPWNCNTIWHPSYIILKFSQKNHSFSKEGSVRLFCQPMTHERYQRGPTFDPSFTSHRDHAHKRRPQNSDKADSAAWPLFTSNLFLEALLIQKYPRIVVVKCHSFSFFSCKRRNQRILCLSLFRKRKCKQTFVYISFSTTNSKRSFSDF